LRAGKSEKFGSSPGPPRVSVDGVRPPESWGPCVSCRNPLKPRPDGHVCNKKVVRGSPQPRMPYAYRNGQLPVGPDLGPASGGEFARGGGPAAWLGGGPAAGGGLSIPCPQPNGTHEKTPFVKIIGEGGGLWPPQRAKGFLKTGRGGQPPKRTPGLGFLKLKKKKQTFSFVLGPRKTQGGPGWPGGFVAVGIPGGPGGWGKGSGRPALGGPHSKNSGLHCASFWGAGEPTHADTPRGASGARFLRFSGGNPPTRPAPKAFIPKGKGFRGKHFRGERFTPALPNPAAGAGKGGPTGSAASRGDKVFWPFRGFQGGSRGGKGLLGKPRGGAGFGAALMFQQRGRHVGRKGTFCGGGLIPGSGVQGGGGDRGTVMMSPLLGAGFLLWATPENFLGGKFLGT